MLAFHSFVCTQRSAFRWSCCPPSTIVMSESFTTVQLPPLAHRGASDRDERRPQAGPLPVKRGEIGFVEGVHVTNRRADESAESTFSLPLHHPADRDYQSPSRRSSSRSLPAANETRAVDGSASPTITKGLFGCLRPKRVTSVGGFQLTTLLFFAIQLIALGGTIALWVFTARRMKANLALKQSENPTGSLTTFIHVFFVVVVLGQLVFLERRVFRLRGERYQHSYGDVLSRHRRSPSSPDSIISTAPWNRPPLPSYAAVLAQSGVGTGDVEDNLIAIPPPPAYGNVRDNTLLHSAR